MKNTLLILMFTSILTVNLQAMEWHAMFGGRYDDLRMCVGSPAGTKGGPVGDIQLDITLKRYDGGRTVLNFPVMRPLLFGAAFSMLQFEPELTFEKKYGKIWRGPGAGVSLHYGPDYKSDLNNRGEEFFAAGPFLSYLIAYDLANVRIGGRIFYSPLFSEAKNPGTVLGVNMEYYFTMGK